MNTLVAQIPFFLRGPTILLAFLGASTIGCVAENTEPSEASSSPEVDGLRLVQIGFRWEGENPQDVLVVLERLPDFDEPISEYQINYFAAAHGGQWGYYGGDLRRCDDDPQCRDGNRIELEANVVRICREVGGGPAAEQARPVQCAEPPACYGAPHEIVEFSWKSAADGRRHSWIGRVNFPNGPHC